MTDSERHKAACFAVASRMPARWLRYYTKSKLLSDPLFPAAFALFGASKLPLLDLGCGIGLLAAYLRERGATQQIVGVDLDLDKVEKAKAYAHHAGYRDVEYYCSDVSTHPLRIAGDIALFDVLHYLPPVAQRRLLRAVAASTGAHGTIAIRDAPRDSNLRYFATVAAEKLAQAVAWNLRVPLHFPTHAELSSSFPCNRFEHEVRPLHRGTPFNNHLFVFRRRSSTTDQLSE